VYYVVSALKNDAGYMLTTVHIDAGKWITCHRFTEKAYRTTRVERHIW